MKKSKLLLVLLISLLLAGVIVLFGCADSTTCPGSAKKECYSGSTYVIYNTEYFNVYWCRDKDCGVDKKPNQKCGC